MKRTNSNLLKNLPYPELNRQIAFHEAGHAAAIYLRNKQLNLPPVYFHIHFKPISEAAYAKTINQNNNILDDAAVIEGGCLVNSLPISLIENKAHFSAQEQTEYMRAFEADVINILVGPLTEAKYTAMRDDEWGNYQLQNLDMLSHYGGSSDLEKVDEYLDCIIASETLRNKKRDQLSQQALRFINTPTIWRAICQLASYIESRESNIIVCEQIIAILDEAIKPKLNSQQSKSPIAHFLRKDQFSH